MIGPGDQSNMPAIGSKNYRAITCKFWLKGACVLGDRCHFEHKFDKEKAPICDEFRRTGRCMDYPDCPFKHEAETVSECNMFNLGFCVYGPTCRFRHVKKEGPPTDPSTLEAAKPKAVRRKDPGLR